MGKKVVEMVSKLEAKLEDPSNREDSIDEEPESKASKVKCSLNNINKNMGQFSEARYAHGENSSSLLSEMDRMRKDFNEIVNEC